MEEVRRYKCNFCQKLAVKKETIERHEKICIHNPEGKNCYMCECSYLDDYDDGNDYSRVIKDQCMCAFNEDVVSAIFRDGNIASNCPMFHRSDRSYWYRTYDQANEYVEQYMGDDAIN